MFRVRIESAGAGFEGWSLPRGFKSRLCGTIRTSGRAAARTSEQHECAGSTFETLGVLGGVWGGVLGVGVFWGCFCGCNARTRRASTCSSGWRTPTWAMRSRACALARRRCRSSCSPPRRRTRRCDAQPGDGAPAGCRRGRRHARPVHGLALAWLLYAAGAVQLLYVAPESVVAHAELLRLDERAARPLRRHLRLQTSH